MTTAYTITNPVPMAALPAITGVAQSFLVNASNPADATFAPDGLAAAPIYGLGGQPLQGNEMIANGVATLKSYVGPLLNSGALCWVLFDCTNGTQQVAAATQSRHAVQFGQVAGVVGQVRNLAMSVTAASASATLTADEIIVETALGGLRYCLASFSKTINLATTGAGGMDTGTAPVSGYVALYAIYNPTTATAALLATNAATKQGNVYGGANMPAGYTASALISVWATDATGKLKIGGQRDRKVSIIPTTVVSINAATASWTVASLAAGAPLNAVRCGGALGLNSSVANAMTLSIGSDANGTAYQYVGGSPAGAQGGSYWLDLITPQTFYYRAVADGTVIGSINVSAYEF